MNRETAAVESKGPDSDPFDLHERLRQLLWRSSQDGGRHLIERLLPAPPANSGAPSLRHDGFYWLLTPEWLADSFGLTSREAGRGLLAELCWIQYCVYALFRIQDDLVDGDTRDTKLAVQANHLLVEAGRCSARHFGGSSPFWDVFQKTIDTTSRTILRLDDLQRSPGRPPGIERQLYAELSACLKIASAGVTLAAGRESDWEKRISPALDNVAVAAQIVDDLWDLRDDLASGQINYAAWYLSRPVFGATPDAIATTVASNLVTTDRLAGLLGEAVEEMDEAIERLGPEMCPCFHAYLNDYRNDVIKLGERIDGSLRDVLCAGTDRDPDDAPDLDGKAADNP